MRILRCLLCGFRYSERDGLPEHGIAPGTRWECIAEHGVCPECGTGKSGFRAVDPESAPTPWIRPRTAPSG